MRAPVVAAVADEPAALCPCGDGGRQGVLAKQHLGQAVRNTLWSVRAM